MIYYIDTRFLDLNIHYGGFKFSEIFIKLGVVIFECSQRVFPMIIYRALHSKGQSQSGMTVWYQCTLTESSPTTAMSKASLGGCPSCGLTRYVPHRAEVRISVSHCKVSNLSLNTPPLPCLLRKHFQRAECLSRCPFAWPCLTRVGGCACPSFSPAGYPRWVHGSAHLAGAQAQGCVPACPQAAAAMARHRHGQAGASASKRQSSSNLI